MNIKKRIRMIGVLGVLSMLVNAAWAYTDDKPQEICRKPKFRGFNLPTYHAENKIEVPPEAELSFTLSGWTDPKTIVVTAKKQPLTLTIEDKMSFFRVKAKLPASLNGKFVRVNASAAAVLGCSSRTGWLLKVANAVPAGDHDNGGITEKKDAGDASEGMQKSK